MSDWTEGYVTDVAYTLGYYHELNPLAAKLALLSAGLVAPACKTACELGFGQGVSVNIHAAASATHWWGTDFNPTQAGFAQEVAAASGGHAQLSDESFAEFARRDDLPQMDYIGVHGIWSWISDVNRSVIVDFVRRRLKVGGVLYVSYNTQPGWAAMVPMRDLLTGHAEVMAASGQGIIGRVDASLRFAERLLATNPAYARANPQIAERMRKLGEQNRNYLAHEYFNRDWEPMSFAAMAAWMEQAKLGYACSAQYFDHVDAMNLTAEQQQLLKDIPDPLFRQTVVDFCVNRQFRKDYWVKGPRRLNPGDQLARLNEHRVVLVTPAADVVLDAPGAQGEVKLSESIYRPVLDALSSHEPVRVGDLATQMQGRGIGVGQLLQALLVLGGKGSVQAAQQESEIAQARATSDRLNRHLMQASAHGEPIGFLASPVTGGAVGVSRFEQLFLLALAGGEQTPDGWGRSAWQELSRQGQRLLKDGKPLDTPDENLHELVAQARDFQARRLPLLRALKVA